MPSLTFRPDGDLSYKSHTAINKFISDSDYLRHMGRVGEWSQEDIDSLVLPTAGEIEVEEADELEEEVDEVQEVEGND